MRRSAAGEMDGWVVADCWLLHLWLLWDTERRLPSSQSAGVTPGCHAGARKGGTETAAIHRGPTLLLKHLSSPL